MGHAGTRLSGPVEGAGLVRVLAIAERLGQRSGDRLAARSRIPDLPREPARDGRIIGRRPREGPRRQPLAQLQGGRAIGLQGVQHLIDRVLVDADRDIAVVLCARPDHGRAADVDVLDRRLEAAGLSWLLGSHRLLKRIEVDPGDIDRADAVLGHGLGVARGVTHAQQSAVDHRVQRLDPPVHHLGEAGQIGHVLHRQAGLFDRRAGAAGRDQFDAEPAQGPGRLDQAGLVGQGDQGPLRGHAIGRRGKVGRGGHGGGRLGFKGWIRSG